MCNFLGSVSPLKNLKLQMEQYHSSVLLGKTKDSALWRSESGPTQKTREERPQSF